MHIQKQLPQFENTSALFIVTGAESAVFYHVADGEVTELDPLHIDPTEPDDAPGRFEQSNRGKTVKSGTAFDPTQVKDDTKQRFIHDLPEHISRIARDAYAHVYIFTPEYMHEQVAGALPEELRKAQTYVHYGNFTKHHPNKLLGMLVKEHTVESRVPVHKLEVKKILSRFWRRRGK